MADGGGAARAEGQYAAAKTSVWWDIENCAVPRDCDPHLIALNISSALDDLGDTNGDTNGIPDAVQRALNSTGVSLNHIPAGVKDASDKKILVDMLLWAVDNPRPANYLLISGDRDFSNALHQLGLRKYNVFLAQPKCTSSVLVAAAKIVWKWPSLVAGGPPMSQLPEACKGKGKNNGNGNGSGNGRSANNGNGNGNGRSANNDNAKAAFPPDVLDIIGSVLSTLNNEKIPPTEANIADCIRYRKMNFDVRIALNYALKSQYLDEHKLGKSPPYYTKKKQTLWECAPPCNNKKHPKEMWDSIQKFLSSAKGRWAMQSSNSRFQATKRLKKGCLTTFVVGDILQILHVIINSKKWILPDATGWQPLSVPCPKS